MPEKHPSRAGQAHDAALGPPEPLVLREEEGLQQVAQALSARTGYPFFRALALNLSKVLDVEHVWVGVLDRQNPHLVHTVAVCRRDRLLDNFSYDARGTPCGNVLGQEHRSYPEGVQRLFPAAQPLAGLGAESYMGTPLFDSAGRPLGLIALLHTRPLERHAGAESVLKISAARAAAELERLRAEEALRESERRYRSVMENAPLCIHTLDLDGHVTGINAAGLAMLGVQHEAQVLGMEMLAVVHPGDRDRIRELLAQARRGQTSRFTFATSDGRIFGSCFIPAKGADERVEYLMGITEDVTERTRADAEMRKLTSAMEQTADIVVITDRDGVIEYVNPAFEKITGYSRAEALGKKPSLVKSGKHEPEFYRRLWKTLLAGEAFSDVFINRRRDGSLYYEEKSVAPLRNAAGRITHFVATGKDITERMRTEERLRFLAYYDVLTGLPNRELLRERAKRAMIEADRHNRLVAILFLDLDRFKVINDTLGHHVGDALLKTVARRLEECVRPGDTIARMSGDEFTVVLADIAHVDDIAHVARKILEQFTRPFDVSGRQLFVTTSIGITLYPFDNNELDALFKNADTAMYHAKDSGRNTFRYFTAELNARAERRLALETSLRHALGRNELHLQFQPQVSLGSGRIIGAEALLRWSSGEHGSVPPAEFIPLAEETGLILPIGEWVLHEACARAVAWRRAGLRPCRLAVNVSSKQLLQKDLPDIVRRVLRDTRLEAGLLDLELTESLLMHDIEGTVELLRELDALGLGISMDDFGTGYSSLSYLKRLPLDLLKVDKSFVHDITRDPDDAAITRAVIAMAHSLDIEVIAEGVETRAQLEFLRRHDCDGIQGFFFSPPLAPGRFAALLKSGRRLALARGGKGKTRKARAARRPGRRRKTPRPARPKGR